MNKALVEAVFDHYVQFSLLHTNRGRDYFFYKYEKMVAQSGMNRKYYEEVFDKIDFALCELTDLIGEEIDGL